MDKIRRSIRSKKESKASEDPSSSTPSLAIRTANAKRIRSEGSTISLTSGTSRAAQRLSKKPRIRSDGNTRHLQVPQDDSHTRESSADDRSSDSAIDSTTAQSSVQLEQGPKDDARKPPWTVRHRIYIDNELISTTTSTQRPGYHKFADFLLREQIETRLYHSHNGSDAHFATRHAVLRFWRGDGDLAEKWMDKDWGGEKEHEFAMENTNDWTILHLSMGGDQGPGADEEEDDNNKDDGEGDTSMEHTMEDAHDNSANDDAVEDTGDEAADSGVEDEETMDQDAEDEDEEEDEVLPTMDITSHYLSDYDDARSIAAAPASALDAGTGSRYHWVEERRRALEHQLLEYYHCTSPTCFNKGGTCLVLGSQHLHVGVRDLTDWSQQIAHASRSIAATTLGLAAKLIDDQTRAQDERLADVGREREDEDDLGEALRLLPVLGGLRPGQGAKADLEPLD